MTVVEWVARMTTLVECWNKLDGNVGELSSWVNAKVSQYNLHVWLNEHTVIIYVIKNPLFINIFPLVTVLARYFSTKYSVFIKI